MARSFNCVVIDRDFTPELPKKFSVNAYPSMLILSPKEENIFRWSGYAETEPFMRQMRTALDRYELYRTGREWDAPNPRPPHISDQGECTLLASPVDDRLNGLCFADGVLWTLYKNTLYELDPASGKTLKTHPIEGDEYFVDLASDESFLYLLPFGYTAGKAIWTFDRKAGQWGARIQTEEYKNEKTHSARGITARDGSLYVSSHHGIQLVDPSTGKVQSTVTVQLEGYRVFGHVGLDFDGDDLVSVATIEKVKLGADGKPVDNSYGLDEERPRLPALLRINPADGKVRDFRILNYPVNSLAFAGGNYYLSEAPVMGYDRQNQPVRLWPKTMAIHRLVYPR